MRKPVSQPKPLPTPQPTTLRHNPTADEFAMWCQHPVTEWVAKAYAIGVDANTASWTAMMNNDATPDDLLRAKIEFQTRADAYSAFLQSTHANYLSTNDPKEYRELYHGEK